MNAAIGKLLTQFDANGRTKPPEKPRVQEASAKPKEIRREPPPPAAAPRPAETPPASLLDDAYRRGFNAGVAEGDAKLAEERVRSAIRLGEERAKWSDQQALAIVDSFKTACRELETNVATSVARVLQPFLADAVRDKAVADLVEQISVLTSNSLMPAFRIIGPNELLELVKARFDPEQRPGIEYQAADVAEVRVVADRTVIETQILMWTERLKAAHR